MAERPLAACPLLREELEALGAGRRLPLDYGEPGCPCRFPPPTGPDAPTEARADALACTAADRGAPATCFQIVAGEALVEELLAAGAHLVTPGWLRGWRGHLDALGLDEAAARELIGGAARRVVLLDTGAGPDAGPELEAFAAHVGLPAERRRVGLDLLRLRVELAATARRARLAEQRAADEAALLDALGGLAPATDEAGVVERFTFLLRLLLAPVRLGYLPLRGGVPAPLVVQGEGDHAGLRRALDAMAAGAMTQELPDGGLLLRVGPPGSEVGRIGCEAVQFPQHLDRYRELAPMLAHACFLSVSRARAMASLARSEAELRRHRDELDQLVAERTVALQKTVVEREAALERARLLSGLIPICFGCKKIRDDAGYWTQLEVYITEHSDATFSHGLCEECLKRLYPDAGP